MKLSVAAQIHFPDISEETYVETLVLIDENEADGTAEAAIWCSFVDGAVYVPVVVEDIEVEVGQKIMGAIGDLLRSAQAVTKHLSILQDKGEAPKPIAHGGIRRYTIETATMMHRIPVEYNAPGEAP